jgi:hypothetical protein
MSTYNNIKFLTGASSGSLTGETFTYEPITGAFRSKIDWDGQSNSAIILFSIDIPRTPEDIQGNTSYPYNSLFIKCIVLKEQSPSNSTTFPVATTGYSGWFTISNPYEDSPQALPPGNYTAQTPSTNVFTQFPIVGTNYTEPTNGIELTNANAPIFQPGISVSFPNRLNVFANGVNATFPYAPFFIKGQYLLV